MTLLGLEEIANLVMAAQVFDKLGNYEDGSGLDATEFWRHSVGVGFAARAISKKLQTEAESAFLAGMLHDVGKIVLDRFFVDYYKQVLEIVADGTTRIVDAETDILGVTHADIGGILASEWKFANTYLNTITYHHKPGKAAKYKRLVCLINIADGLTRELGFGSGGDSVVPDLDEAALDQFHNGRPWYSDVEGCRRRGIGGCGFVPGCAEELEVLTVVGKRHRLRINRGRFFICHMTRWYAGVRSIGEIRPSSSRRSWIRSLVGGCLRSQRDLTSCSVV